MIANNTQSVPYMQSVKNFVDLTLLPHSSPVGDPNRAGIIDNKETTFLSPFKEYQINYCKLS
jgi:hypothetical protein